MLNDSGGGCGDATNNTITTTGNGNNDTSGGNGDNGNDNNGDAQTTDNNKENTSKEINLNCEKDELVLDVLNDDLIAKVRCKIHSKYKRNIPPPWMTSNNELMNKTKCGGRTGPKAQATSARSYTIVSIYII